MMKLAIEIYDNSFINEGRNYQELKVNIIMINSQRSDTEKTNLIREAKKIGIDEVIKHNEFINNSLKSKI